MILSNHLEDLDMPLNLDVVCTEPQLPQLDRQEKVAQVIGEILPFVLAKYGIEFQSTPRTEVPHNSNDPSFRFNRV